MKTLKEISFEFTQKSEADVSVKDKALLCRSVLEQAIEHIFQKNNMVLPKNATLLELIDNTIVRRYVSNEDLAESLHFVRILGMHASHGKKVRQKDVDLSIKNIHELLLFLEMKEQGRDNQYEEPPYMSEKMTRKLYIDLYLQEAGWEVLEEENVIAPGKAGIEIKVDGMPNPQGIGFCDYVLYGTNGKPLAIVEAKKTSVDPSKGRHQVDLYGECMKAKYGYKPVLYYTNGYSIKVIDGVYPDRDVAAFHSLKDLEWMMQQRDKGDISDISINDDITNRPYQKIAITKMCERFNDKYRKGLIVMATGTGKTRVAVSLVDVLLRNKWIKNVLFLADRTSLVGQAKRAFDSLLPDMSICELSGSGEKDYNARLMFSTYQTMINYIDAEDKEFSAGRFDLIIIDEAHRSVFNKYGTIFQYFDSLLVGLTATPKDEVDLNTYKLFGCESGIPNFDFSLEEAVKEKYLVPYKVINKTTAILDRGIKYSELSEDERDQLEEYFEYTEVVPSPEFDVGKGDWFAKLYNKDTCRKVLEDLMNYGIKVNGGETIGKTVIFAYNHKHAKQIVDTFHEMYPKYEGNYCQLVDNYISYADDLVLKFNTDSSFRIAVSVDMLDTGIDVPDITNLVFFKPVRSKIKFIQMIGRGTRLCENLFGLGQNKEYFLIFDYCKNFEYFGTHPEGNSPTVTYSLSQKLFDVRLDMLEELQQLKFQQEEYTKNYYDEIKNELQSKVREIKKNDKRIQVRNEMQYVDKYCVNKNWDSLSAVNKREIKIHLTPLIDSGLDGEQKVISYDVRFYNIELSVLQKGSISAAIDHVKVIRRVLKFLLDKKASLPQVINKAELLQKLVAEDYWKNVEIESLENSRTETRELMQFLVTEAKSWLVDIHDVSEDREPIVDEFANFDIRTYREKVIDYLIENSSSPVIQKIKQLEPINNNDLIELQRILWEELGTKEEYEKTTTNNNVAAFIRSLVGLDQSVVNQRFGEYLNGTSLNSLQQEFIRTIINYVRENGDITKEDLLETSPFNDYDLITLFGDKVQAVISIVNTLHESVRAAA